MIFDKKNAGKVKLVAFDLDGTLTQHKSPLDEKNKSVLDRLAKKYKLLMVGAGQCRRIFEQMGRYPIDIIGNYGMQYYEYDEKTKDLREVENLSVSCDRDICEERVTAMRKKYGFTSFAGENVEYHVSGCVTFPILGTAAKIEDKLAFDPDRSKRRKIYAEVCAEFPEYTTYVGGSSSFDIVPKPYGKYEALSRYCKAHGIGEDEAVFVGDDYGTGGNDEPVFVSPIPFIRVDDYRRLEEYLTDIL